ncbi:woronin body major protein [Drepanopeziza brunnea f. sp. 'multigermtubi' MB_m1]|uniref:Woronin body major protein n=1 Tax=Marssonina brunnea f. sp. multigermtubi (strain MB_m1) TaxID=1072389 RepID=K1X069_MARBU|nr:woronin body major protein [Drepanopeziza brunnea f. sp. 'multigermtubi' MB_m1]EKD14263.1 woronin body major protein [Drepanopeziza brunnea f. sp. 'multigermtubi' MB_m1]
MGWDELVNLDFDARVPIPFSVFPSSYRSDEVAAAAAAAAGTAASNTTQTHVEGEVKLPGHAHGQEQRHGRESHLEAFAQQEVRLPARDEQYQEDVYIHHEEEQKRRKQQQQQQQQGHPQIQQNHRSSHREETTYLQEERRPVTTKHTTTHIDIELPHRPHFRRQHNQHTHDTTVHIEGPQPQRRRYQGTEIDIAERAYRARYQPSYREDERVNVTTVDPPPFQPGSSYQQEIRVSGSTVDPPRFQAQPPLHTQTRVSQETVDPPRYTQPTRTSQVEFTQETVDPPRFIEPARRSHVEFTQETVDPPRPVAPPRHSHVEFTEETVDIPRTKSKKMGYYDDEGSSRAGPAPVHAPEPAYSSNTVSIPCHHIRLGDLLILQGRPCQVIRITTSSATGQHRYLGVDLFTKQLHEESSFIANPSPSVVVQTMLGPVFKQYRVLDLQDGVVVAMTETGDVKQSLPVIDQSNLWQRLSEAFETGRGSVRVLVISDRGRELAVDMKTIHGSRL